MTMIGRSSLSGFGEREKEIEGETRRRNVRSFERDKG